MMGACMKSLVAYGERLGLEYTQEMTKKKGTGFVWELSSGNLVPFETKVTLVVPKAKKSRGQRLLVNDLYDASGYMFGNERRRAAFRDRAVFICDQAGDKEALEAVERAFAEDPPGAAALDRDAWIFLALQGTLLFQRPKIAAFLKQEYSEALVHRSGTKDEICLVSGEPCVFERLHPGIVGVPGGKNKSSLVSFNNDAFAYERQKQGKNAPMSFRTMALYERALNFMLEKLPDGLRRGSAELLKDHALLFWPEEGPTDAPILKHASVLMGGFFLKWTDVNREWAELEACAQVDASVRLLLISGNEGRISLVRDGVTSLRTVRESLLWFRDAMLPWKPSPYFHNTVKINPEYKKDVGNDKIVSDPMKLEIAWALLTGARFPRGFSAQLSQQLAFNTDHVLPLATWLEAAWLREHPERKVRRMNPQHSSDEKMEEPTLGEYLLPRADGGDDPAYRLGRGVALFIALRRHAHAEKPIDARDADELAQALQNPRGYLSKLVEKAALYREMCIKKERNQTLVRAWEDLRLSALGIRTTPAQREKISLGYKDQERFNTAFFRWRSQQNKKIRRDREQTSDAASAAE
jgi:hypothetical protein